MYSYRHYGKAQNRCLIGGSGRDIRKDAVVMKSGHGYDDINSFIIRFKDKSVKRDL